MNEQIVAVDIGGTHARFALATLAGCRVVDLGATVTLRTADHVDIRSAWEHFVRQTEGAVPRAAALAIAGPIGGDVIRLTNNPWSIRPADIAAELGVDRVTLVNDFEAVGHAVAQADDGCFEWLCGPVGPLPANGTISVVGPGTGLGVAHVLRDGGNYHVQATEGGHIGFAPIDAVDDILLARLRTRHDRVSAERVVSGPAIVDIHQALAAQETRDVVPLDDRTLWERGLNGEDSLAAAAVEHFCLSLGSVAGDLALAHGASALVIAGGLGLRLRDRLASSGFADRFIAKGRYVDYMRKIAVKQITHPQPGLFGAAAAFARQWAPQAG